VNNIDIRKIENKLIQPSRQKNIKLTNITQKNFNEVLESINKNNKDIKFSKHATKRLINRNMNISSGEMERLENAFNQAKSKDVKDALIIMDNKAFIVNVNSKTIITTVSKEQLKDNVFTNIDGAVII